MSLRLAAARLSVPAPLRRAGLDELADAAASAFGRPRPSWRGMDYSGRLTAFARFTALEADAAVRDGRADTMRSELRARAERVGERMRRRLGVRSHEEALRALELLYRQLSISLKAGGDGALEVSHCFFSPFYSSDACRVMSAMDEGIVAGLTGGCELCFEARITDGAPRCVASLRRPASCG